MSEPQPRRVENSIMRLALSSTEATLGKSGYHAVVHVAGLERLLETPPPDNTKLETPGDDLAALLAAILNMYGESSSRGLFRRWGATFGTTAVKRRPSDSQAAACHRLTLTLTIIQLPVRPPSNDPICL